MQKRINCVLCTECNIDENSDNKEISQQKCIRIFRNIKGLSYEGSIHENITINGETPSYIFDKDIIILHTGYSAVLWQDKLKRNLEILKSIKMDDTEPNFKNQFYLASTYWGLQTV